MEPNQVKPKSNAMDFFLNLGAIVALYTLVYSLISLLFTVIDKAFPPINNYYYGTSTTISWPVATLVVFFPIFIVLMSLLAKQYAVEPERQTYGIHKWLTYLTLFIAGLTIAGDLITVLYYFINGENLTAGFMMKVVVLLVIAVSVFAYYLSDVRGKLTSSSRMYWRVFAGALVLISVAWGFYVLGSPASQRLSKYDDQKVMELQTINNYVMNYYQMKASLPGSLTDIQTNEPYARLPVDPQSGKSYEYVLIGQSAKAYQLCADFNKASNKEIPSVPAIYQYGNVTWTHPAGHYCFTESIPVSMYPGGKLPM